jgi:hypothetical protein
MFDFEYNIIIDHWSDKFGVNLSERDRKNLIHAFEETTQEADYEIDFDRVCKNACMCRYLNEKYPTLGLCKRVFLIHNLN